MVRKYTIYVPTLCDYPNIAGQDTRKFSLYGLSIIQAWVASYYSNPCKDDIMIPIRESCNLSMNPAL